MIEISHTDAAEVLSDASYDQVIQRAGGDRHIMRYQTDTGYIIEFQTAQEDKKFFYLDESQAELNPLESLLRANISQMPSNLKEIELYRWGLETPEKATLDTFGLYRVLITKENGEMEWLCDQDGTQLNFSTLTEAQEVCKSKKLKSCTPMVV
ncbi:hypothetical protein JCM30760_26270 [Thiomicrorhabdus hydrogeniphila]